MLWGCPHHDLEGRFGGQGDADDLLHQDAAYSVATRALAHSCSRDLNRDFAAVGQHSLQVQ